MWSRVSPLSRSGTVAGTGTFDPFLSPLVCRPFASASSRFRNSTARAPHIARCDGVRSRRLCFENTYATGSAGVMDLNRGMPASNLLTMCRGRRSPRLAPAEVAVRHPAKRAVRVQGRHSVASLADEDVGNDPSPAVAGKQQQQQQNPRRRQTWGTSCQVMVSRAGEGNLRASERGFDRESSPTAPVNTLLEAFDRYC